MCRCIYQLTCYISCSVVLVQGKTALDLLLEFHRRSIDEMSCDEVVDVKDVENLLRTKMRLGGTRTPSSLSNVTDSVLL